MVLRAFWDKLPTIGTSLTHALIKNCPLSCGAAQPPYFVTATREEAKPTQRYGQEKGLFFLAAERLLHDLSNIVGQKQADSNKDEQLFLRATACEIYLDQVYDLIGPEKRACKIRIDGDGQLVVHGEVTTEELDGVSKDCRHGNHATLVTLAPGLSSIPIHKPEDLEALSQTCIVQRACGTSTANNTSSRSHAILRLEVVSTAINRARDTLQLRQAEIPALKNAKDNSSDIREKKRLLARLQSTEAEIQKMTMELVKLQTNGPAALGGSMLLECFRCIASTTNDAASQSKQQRPQQRPPFRRSKLTRILEDSLAPRETSRRQNKESVCVMLVNVSPASNLKHGTINALRYGQLFAGGQGGGKSSSTNKTSSESRMAQLRKQAKENLHQQTNDPNVDPAVWKQEIREIYSEYVPEKSKADVEEILSKFVGREQMLLDRVKSKYTVHIA